MQGAEYGSFYHPVSDGQTESVQVRRHALRHGLRQIGSQRRMWLAARVESLSDAEFQRFIALRRKVAQGSARR
jgi:hypothetical protein